MKLLLRLTTYMKGYWKQRKKINVLETAWELDFFRRHKKAEKMLKIL